MNHTAVKSNSSDQKIYDIFKGNVNDEMEQIYVFKSCNVIQLSYPVKYYLIYITGDFIVQGLEQYLDFVM